MASLWTAPAVDRIDEPFTGTERPMLEGFLDYQRATLLGKCAGLSAEQLCRRSVAPSTMSLLGLVRHLTQVERHWFRHRYAGLDLPRIHAGEAAFEGADPATAEMDLLRFEDEISLVRLDVAPLPLDYTYAHPKFGPMSLRWGFQHMICEYARHNGHADVLRERIDGRTGG
jgi:hypothetical protein